MASATKPVDNKKQDAKQADSEVNTGNIDMEVDYSEGEDEGDTFGDLVPFGDPYWYQSWNSPYYDASHRRLRAYMRKFIDEEITPNCHEWDNQRQIPKKVFERFAELGILSAMVSNKWPAEYAKGLPVPADVKPEEWNAFHFFVVLDEMCRCGSGGLVWGIAGGLGIGLPPVMHFGSEEMRNRVVPPCLRGEKRICLAITEPSVGSDVANLTTTAEKTPDGKHYIVNGEKKWITNGVYSDYFTTAVRTGGKGMGGISLLLIEKDFPGVTVKKMDCMGVLSSGTTYIEFDDVKVPVENLIGKENKGFQLIMSNFNSERMGIAVQSLRFARVCYEDAMKYASKRKTFGVLLREHGVIRAKLGNMAAAIESCQAWLEQIVYQSTKFDPEDLTLRGGGVVALAKAKTTEVFEYCAREAVQILGGIAYTRGGQGERVERLYREAKAYSIPGGSAEIMIDLGVRQSVKIAEIMGAKL